MSHFCVGGHVGFVCSVVVLFYPWVVVEHSCTLPNVLVKHFVELMKHMTWLHVSGCESRYRTLVDMWPV